MGLAGEPPLAPEDPLAPPPLQARRHQPGELRAVFGDPPVSTVGEPREARERGRRGAAPWQQSQQRREGGTSRTSLAGGRDQVPGGHSLGGIEVGEKVVGLGLPQGNRAQERFAIPAKQAGEEPGAEPAVRVVEDRPAVLGTGQRAAAQASATSRISGG